MNLDEDTILRRANEYYFKAKYGPAADDHKLLDAVFGFPPRGEIQSEQVKALLRALVEAINGAE